MGGMVWERKREALQKQEGYERKQGSYGEMVGGKNVNKLSPGFKCNYHNDDISK